MARIPNQFIDPVPGGQPTYAWDLNHDTEEALGKTRNVEHTANTGLTGLVRQQGPGQPMILKISGTIMKKSQFDQMWLYFTICEGHTIHYQDFSGVRYEVVITDFQPKKVRAVRNSRDQANAPQWYWKYTMTMEVLGFVSGGPFVAP